MFIKSCMCKRNDIQRNVSHVNDKDRQNYEVLLLSQQGQCQSQVHPKSNPSIPCLHSIHELWCIGVHKERSSPWLEWQGFQKFFRSTHRKNVCKSHLWQEQISIADFRIIVSPKHVLSRICAFFLVAVTSLPITHKRKMIFANNDALMLWCHLSQSTKYFFKKILIHVWALHWAHEVKCNCSTIERLKFYLE